MNTELFFKMFLFLEIYQILKKNSRRPWTRKKREGKNMLRIVVYTQQLY
jgi:hypothetical protein